MVKCSHASLNTVFRALADPTRRGILELLAKTTKCSVTDVAKPFAISLPGISKHLRVLESAGLIRREHEGRVHRLSLEAEKMREAADWIEQYRHFWDGQFGALSRYLERQPKQKEKE